MSARLMQVIQGPVVSEKSTMAGEMGQYVFRVLPDASKDEIKAAVEQLFEVRVENVRTLKQQGKQKRFGPPVRASQPLEEGLCVARRRRKHRHG